MESIKVLIVEDKAIIAESISALLKKHSFQVVGICDAGEDALKLVDTNSPDLIIMDIQLAGALDGISTAKMIRDTHDIPVIYLTDFDDRHTVDRAKLTRPATYLTKPFQEAELIRALDIAFYNANHQGKQIQKAGSSRFILLATENQSYNKLDIDSILYIDAGRAYCTIVTENGTYTMTKNMKHIHEQLPGDKFIKIHRSHVINVDKVTRLEGNVVHIGKHQVQMSQEYKELVKGRFTIIK